MNTELNSFETALLARLHEHVVPKSVAHPRLTPRRLLGGAVAAAAAAIVVLVPGVGSNPAYSVVEGNVGEITVEVKRLEDADGLEAELKDFGIKADITYLPDRQECAAGRYEPVDRNLSGMSVSMGSHLLRVVLPPGTVRDGETFVMAVSGEALPRSSNPSADGITETDGFSGWADFDVATGSVRPCRPVPGSAG